MFSTHNEEKSNVAERFIRNLKNKIYKYITSASKNLYVDKLDAIINKCSNTYPKFNVGGHVRRYFHKRLYSKLVRRSFRDLKS